MPQWMPLVTTILESIIRSRDPASRQSVLVHDRRIRGFLVGCAVFNSRFPYLHTYLFKQRTCSQSV